MKKEEIRCYCGKWAKSAKLKLEGLLVDGWKCPSCKEQYLSPEASLQISALKKIKEKFLEATVTQTGNSLAIRVKKDLALAMDLKKGNKLKIQLKTPKKAVIEA